MSARKVKYCVVCQGPVGGTAHKLCSNKCREVHFKRRNRFYKNRPDVKERERLNAAKPLRRARVKQYRATRATFFREYGRLYARVWRANPKNKQRQLDLARKLYRKDNSRFLANTRKARERSRNNDPLFFKKKRDFALKERLQVQALLESGLLSGFKRSRDRREILQAARALGLVGGRNG